MNTTEALTDLQTLLVEGVAVEAAISEVASEYGLTAVFLINRAERAFGDLRTYAERRAEQRALMATQEQEAQRKMALTEAKAKIEAHNRARPGSPDRMSAEQLQHMVELANSLGGNFTLRAPRRRRHSPDSLDRALRSLLRLLVEGQRAA